MPKVKMRLSKGRELWHGMLLADYLNHQGRNQPDLYFSWLKHSEDIDVWEETGPPRKRTRRRIRCQEELRAIADLYIAGDIPGTIQALGPRLQRLRASYLLVEVRGGKPPISVMPISDPDTGALINFARFLESEYWDCLRKCAECGTYFLDYKRKRKVYCSQSCQWQARDRRVRERDPSSYNAKKAAAMRKLYWKKKTGPPPGPGR